MASIAIKVGAAVVNAIALKPGSALFDNFDRRDGSEERLRHDEAMEDLQKARAESSEKRAETLARIISKLRDKNDARAVFDDVDRALEA